VPARFELSLGLSHLLLDTGQFNATGGETPARQDERTNPQRGWQSVYLLWLHPASQVPHWVDRQAPGDAMLRPAARQPDSAGQVSSSASPRVASMDLTAG
jgi:hypothetical protein